MRPELNPGLLAVLLAAMVGAGEATAEMRFVERAEEWGLAFRHHHGGSGKRYMAETVPSGVVLFDFDGDGDVDVFFIDAGPLPGYSGEPTSSRLYRNDGVGVFAEVTGRAGVAVERYGCGGTAGDYDGDGDLDLYVTTFGVNLLLSNDGDGSFTDVTEEAGVGDTQWSSSAMFSDFDRDGDLDLYVVNYVDFTLETHKFCGNEETGLQGYCAPDAYDGIPDRYYRNRGDGTFEDATAAAGLSAAKGAGLGVIAADLNNDGWPDLYVANDRDPNFLFMNRGDGTFEDSSLISGTAYSQMGQAEGGMGVDVGDIDGNGLLDIVVTNFEFETNALYRNNGDGLFVDSRFAFRLAESSFLSLAFGVALADLDQDGDLDALMANGHILDNAGQFNEGSQYAQRNQLFENQNGERFREVGDSGIDVVRVSRGLATGDLDIDGDLDVVISNSNDVAEVYENLGAGEGWMQIDLKSRSGNRFGIDARVQLDAAGQSQLREVRTGSSYLSQNALTVHFGLVDTRRVDGLTLAWPSGLGQRFVDLPANRRLAFIE